VDWIEPAQENGQWQSLANTKMNFWDPHRKRGVNWPPEELSASRRLIK